jgi:hypothetical protein
MLLRIGGLQRRQRCEQDCGDEDARVLHGGVLRNSVG